MNNCDYSEFKFVLKADDAKAIATFYKELLSKTSVPEVLEKFNEFYLVADSEFSIHDLMLAIARQSQQGIFELDILFDDDFCLVESCSLITEILINLDYTVFYMNPTTRECLGADEQADAEFERYCEDKGKLQVMIRVVWA
jgi:hypothetical protein